MARRSIAIVALVLSIAGPATLGACGDDGGASATGDAGEGGPELDASDATADAPARADFGLDSRPSNKTCVAPARPPTTAPVVFERIYANVALGGIMAMAQAPGDPSRWFAAFRDGRIGSFPVVSPPAAPTIVANLAALSGMPVNQDVEGGFLGFAFDPKFAQNGRLYASWTTTGGGSSDMRSVVSRLTSTDNGASFGVHAAILGPFEQPYPAHVGGGIQFGPDGRLYLSFGDGLPDSPYGQRRDLLYAKILRIDVDTPPPPGKTFVIPPDNPFAAGGGEPATFAYGFRNPFRFSFDRESGDLWVADVGEEDWEEIDVVRSGGNYGWPCRQGAHDWITPAMDPVKCPNASGLVEPVAEIEHVGRQARSITGGYVYRGKAIPALVGTYFFADFVTQEISSLSFDPSTGAPSTKILDAGVLGGSWVSFAEDAQGELYVLSITGEVYRMVAAGAAVTPTFPDRLSKTGCFDAADPKKPAPGLIPYGVNAQLWSDGASKDRWLAVPDGATIAVGAGGDFDLPRGSVVAKTFSTGALRIETRLLVRHDDGAWAGYDYEWNDAQTDAVLLASSKTKKVGAGSWYLPSRSDCVRCHTAAAGRTLGLEVGQLDGDFAYASTNRVANQLRTLEHIGLFATPLVAPGSRVALPDPSAPGPLEPRARAYLHANCAGCHRPGVVSRSDLDLRFSTPLRDTRSCAVAPKGGDLGVANAKLLAPGSPSSSLLSLRPRALGAARMPPLGSNVVDTAGLGVVDAWISSVAQCP